MATASPARPRRSAFRRREVIEGYLFASPFIIGFLVFIAFPMIWAFVLMFQRYNLLRPPMFIGLTNVQDMLADPKTWQSMWNTIYYAFVSVPLQLALAFGCAVLLNQPLRGRNFYRTALYLPVIVPIVVSAFIWQRAYHPDFGIINEMIGWFGIPPQQWLFEPVLAKPAFIFMRIWVMGTQMVIFLAGLQNVPQSLLEAAALDGANAWRKFWNVTVPIMTPVIFFNLIVGIIGNFQVFAPALIMTKGGPQDATLFMVLYIYRNAFEYSKLGYAAALSWLLFLFIILLTIIQFRGSGRWVFYESD
ncbi:MAG: sugar ABC transporter permease [Caldilinea sp.]|nr:sugar ABC transporter permease [Caldilinea sp.]MCB0065945.1 sugar ABC transporter permease [Caldilineaceae bacterium]MCB0041877.1 sugar ABC transporter permease [Caldilinea sp.]MCB0151679.1 sugar ABC transporter permease [Caldilineaceae bacterium]MCB9114068.1 sugar ABC transporter permease [Caldilineaceae bacterium]